MNDGKVPIQACVLFFKFCESRPFHTIFLDILFADKNKSVSALKKEIYSKYGIGEKIRNLSMKECQVEIGYAIKLPSGNLNISSFVESITDEQWQFARQKCTNDRNYSFVIKIRENTDRDSLTSRLSRAAKRPHEDECIGSVNPVEAKQHIRTRAKPRDKKQLDTDSQLWSNLKPSYNHTTPVRTETQLKRLQEWKREVSSRYPSCEALDERNVKCNCGKRFQVNKFNALADIGRVHVNSCLAKQASASSQKQDIRAAFGKAKVVLKTQKEIGEKPFVITSSETDLTESEENCAISKK
eukprot:Seg2833.2 transcript_id=Seg2833.2/GoldUCD/mRNA.D3Y31 product="hypothetical protein" protein_id=Seg2833.2/GoldUCD/D3Y31